MMKLGAMVLGTILALGGGVSLAADVWQEPLTGMEFVSLPKGCFKMGVPEGSFTYGGGVFQHRTKVEMPDHEVCLDAFWIGRYEVREQEWQQLMGERPGSRAPGLPVTAITWEEASEFARRLSEKAPAGERFRLPTEAEWEYACRAGAKAVTEVPEQNSLTAHAWFSAPYDEFSRQWPPTLQPVGTRTANAFGLYDMLGNAWEWVQDSYSPDAYARHPLFNPLVNEAGAGKRVIRGGGIRTGAHFIRCEARSWLPPAHPTDTVGVRLVRDR